MLTPIDHHTRRSREGLRARGLLRGDLALQPPYLRNFEVATGYPLCRFGSDDDGREQAADSRVASRCRRAVVGYRICGLDEV